MTLNEYQAWQKKQGYYPGKGSIEGLTYTVLALNGEAGELSNLVKKRLRDNKWSPAAAILELGDILWYASAVADELACSLETIADANIKKITKRRGTTNE